MSLDTVGNQPFEGLSSEQSKVATALSKSFIESEVEEICFELGIDYTQLPGGIRSEKHASLVKMCADENILTNVYDAIADKNPYTGFEPSGKEYKRISPDLVKIKECIHKTIKDSDFKDLCDSVGVKWDDLRGNTHLQHVLALIKQSQEKNMFDTLSKNVKKKRPHFFDTAPTNTTYQPTPNQFRTQPLFAQSGGMVTNRFKPAEQSSFTQPNATADRLRASASQERTKLTKSPEGVLRESLAAKLTKAETVRIAKILGIDYEDLASPVEEADDIASQNEGKIRELIEYTKKRGSMFDKFLKVISSETTGVDLSAFGVTPDKKTDKKIELPATVQLADLLTSTVLPHELKLIAIHTGITPETIAGQTHPEKAAGLVGYFEKRQKLNVLLAAIKAVRSDINVSNFDGIFKKEETSQRTEFGSAINKNPITKIRELIIDKILPDEFSKILVLAGINPDTFHTDYNYESKARELITLMKKRDMTLQNLSQIVSEVRPDINLDQIINPDKHPEASSWKRPAETLLDYVKTLTQSINSLDKVQKICSLLKVEYNEIPGENATDKIIGLSRYMYSRDRQLSEIQTAIKEIKN